MTVVMKVGLLALAGVLLAVQFKAQKPEYSLYIGLVVSILIFAFCIGQAQGMMEALERIRGYLGSGGEYLGILLKVIGITYVCEFGAGICKDAGYGTIADQVEIVGKLAVIFAGLPILFAVIEQLHAFM